MERCLSVGLVVEIHHSAVSHQAAAEEEDRPAWVNGGSLLVRRLNKKPACDARRPMFELDDTRCHRPSCARAAILFFLIFAFQSFSVSAG